MSTSTVPVLTRTELATLVAELPFAIRFHDHEVAELVEMVRNGFLTAALDELRLEYTTHIHADNYAKSVTLEGAIEKVEQRLAYENGVMSAAGWHGECPGHPAEDCGPAGEHESIGATIYCDGSCQAISVEHEDRVEHHRGEIEAEEAADEELGKRLPEYTADAISNLSDEDFETLSRNVEREQHERKAAAQAPRSQATRTLEWLNE